MQARECSAMRLNTILILVSGMSVVAVVSDKTQYQVFCAFQPYFQLSFHRNNRFLKSTTKVV